MNLFSGLQKLIARGVNALAGKASRLLRHPRKSKSPLADRLLADALRLAEIPSPTVKEERRAEFVLERLQTLGLNPLVDEGGTILIRLQSADLVNEPPLLLFADLGSSRWHPLESLSRLDAENAQGAGLADSLGAAALLSVAEGMVTGRLQSRRDLILLFAARSLADPEERAVQALLNDPLNRPWAALVVRGLTQGSLVTRLRGMYRLEISFFQDRREPPARGGAQKAGAAGARPGKEEPDPRSDSPPPVSRPVVGPVVYALLSTAQRLSDIPLERGGDTRLYLRRIEAGAAFERIPSEGILEIELESTDGTQLEMVLGMVKAMVEEVREIPDITVDTRIISAIPVGDPAINRDLMKIALACMKDQRIKMQEEQGTDLSTFFSAQGIPAVSLGIALGREGRTRDVIEIASIEKGRAFLETLITQAAKEVL